MKKIFAVLLAFLCLYSCATYKDIKVNSVQVEKVSMFSDPWSATIAVEINNPTMTLNVIEAVGVVKIAGDKALDVVCDPFVLAGHSCQTYQIDLTATIVEGFGISSFMRLFQSQDFSKVTLDLELIVKDPLGIKHTKVMKDISLL